MSSVHFSSVQSLSCVRPFVTPDRHARPPCPSPTPGVHPNSRASSRWCHPAISSSVITFSFCPQSLPASESFQMSQLFAWGGQSIGVSASASVLPMNTLHINPRSHLSSARNFLIGIALDLWVNLKRAGIFITLAGPIRGAWSLSIYSGHMRVSHSG